MSCPASTPRCRARHATRSHSRDSTSCAVSAVVSANVRSLEIVPDTTPCGSCSRNVGRSRPSSSLPSPRAAARMPPRYAPKIGRNSASGAATSCPSVTIPTWCRRLSATGPIPGSLRTGSGASVAASVPARDQQHARRLGQPARHLRHRLARRDPRARRQPELAIDRRRHLAHDAEDRRVVVVAPRPPVQPLAAAEVEVVLVDARRDHDGAEALDDLARAPRVVAVRLVVAGDEHGVTGRAVGGLADRHPGAHAEGAHLVARRRHHARARRDAHRRRPACRAGSDRAGARRTRRTYRDRGSTSAELASRAPSCT